MQDPVEVQRMLITSSLLAGAYIAYTCPCKNPFLSCHIKEFGLFVGLPLVYAIYLNRNNLYSKE
jgi:hypothetical protein